MFAKHCLGAVKLTSITNDTNNDKHNMFLALIANKCYTNE